MTALGLRRLHTPRSTRAANALVEDFTAKLVARANTHLPKDCLESEPRVTPLAAVTRAGLPTDEICAEILDHVGAGMDTTSTTLTYLFHRLACRADIQSSLRLSIPRPSSFESKLDYLTALEATPLLTAVIKETLRLHAAIPGPEPRLVPPEGMALSGPDPVALRGGTVVAAQAWTLHRNVGIFGADAAEWRPERWPSKDEEGVKRLERGMMPFGRGARACIGKDLAMWVSSSIKRASD